MFDLLSRYWWSLIVRGAFAILLGILAFVRPGVTLATLLIFFGGYAFVDGVFAIFAAWDKSGKSNERWLLLLQGLLGIGVGIMSLRAPGITTILVLLYIGLWSLSTGVLEILAGIHLRKEIKGEWWMLLSGIVSIWFGFLLMVFPALGGIGLVWLVAFYAIVLGAILILLGLKLHGLRSQRTAARQERVFNADRD